MTQVFEWANTRGYELHDGVKAKLAAGLIKKMSQHRLWYPLSHAIAKTDLREVPGGMAKTSALLGQLGGALLKQLKKMDEEYEALHGWPMEYRELLAATEQIREKDSAHFHKWFRPASLATQQ